MKNILKNIRYTSIVQDILIIIFGIVIINMKYLFLNILSISIAAFFILKGVIEICRYIMAKGINEFYRQDLILGIISILIGIIILIAKGMIYWMFNLGIALYIIYGAVEDLVMAIKFKSLNINLWIFMAIMALVVGLFGIAVLFNKGMIINVAAIVIIIYAVIDLIENLVIIKNSKEIFE